MAAYAISILLVEDNPCDVDIARRAFSRSPVPTGLHVARDGREALDYLLHQGAYAGDSSEAPRPDLVLLDVNLPRLNGLEVLERIRAVEEISTLPVVMLTSSGRPEDVARAYELGANTYINKPMEFETFEHALVTLNEYWTAVATLPPAAAAGSKRRTPS